MQDYFCSILLAKASPKVSPDLGGKEWKPRLDGRRHKNHITKSIVVGWKVAPNPCQFPGICECYLLQQQLWFRIFRGRVYPGLLSKWDLNAVTWVLIRERLREFENHRREGDDVKTEAEVGLMWPQAKERLNQRKWDLSLCRKCAHANTLIVDLWPSKLWENKFIYI